VGRYLERLLRWTGDDEERKVVQQAETSAREVVCNVNLGIEQYRRAQDLARILAKSYVFS
jgi:hypothetical protein